MPLNPTQLSALTSLYQKEVDSQINDWGKTLTLYFKDSNAVVSPEYQDIIRDEGIKKPIFMTNTGQPQITPRTLAIKGNYQQLSKDFNKFGILIKEGKNVLELKTFLSNAADLTKCDYLVPDSSISNSIYGKYRLLRSIIPYGFRVQRYCISFWEQI